MNHHRLAPLSLALAAAVLCSACIVLPSGRVSEPSDVTRMSEQAAQTCGAGQVKEVNAKSFTCK
jgi:hypothetical protein